MKRIRYMALIGLVSASMIGVLAPASAAADEAEPAISSSSMLEAPMTVMAIDDEQAAKAGNRVAIEGESKVLYDGRTGEELSRIPLDPSAPTAKSRVYGDCGSSYYWLKDKSGEHNYEFATGFDLKSDAYDFNWGTVVRAEWESGSYNFEWGDDGPQVPGPSWTSGWREDITDAPPGVWHYGRVTNGTAYLTSGEICYTGYPNEGNYVR